MDLHFLVDLVCRQGRVYPIPDAPAAHARVIDTGRTRYAVEATKTTPNNIDTHANLRNNSSKVVDDNDGSNNYNIYLVTPRMLDWDLSFLEARTKSSSKDGA